MSKKIISLILCGILVFGTFSTSYAVSTDSAIKSTKDLMSVSDIKANGDTVAPVSSTGVVNYYNGTSSNASYNLTLSNWAGLITGITDSISRSIRYLSSSLGTGLSNVKDAVDDVWDRLGVILSSVDQIEGYIDSLETYLYTADTYLSDLKSYISTGNTTTSNIKTDTGNIYSLLQTGLIMDLGSPWQPYFMPADNYNFNNNDWDYYYIRTVDEWGNVSSTYKTETNYLLGLKNLLTYINLNNTYGFRNIAKGVGGNSNTSFVPKLYNLDLTTTNADKISIWRSILQYGENTSMFLSRLAFVLASDEEIEARQAATANQDAVVDDFIKPTGSGSASASDFADVASIGGTMKDALDSNVSAGTAFTSLSSSSDAWKWFTADTANSLDTTSNQRSSISSTPLLDNFYSEVLENLRFK